MGLSSSLAQNEQTGKYFVMIMGIRLGCSQGQNGLFWQSRGHNSVQNGHIKPYRDLDQDDLPLSITRPGVSRDRLSVDFRSVPYNCPVCSQFVEKMKSVKKNEIS